MKTSTAAAFLFLASLPAAAQVPEPEGIEWVTSPNYSSRNGTPIDAIVMHTSEGSGTLSGTVGYFQNPDSQVSTHYLIGPAGEIVQMVEVEMKAWHATYYNARSIGIEMIGFSGKPETWNEQNLAALVKLVAWLCWKYDIPVVHPEGDAYDYPNDTLDFSGIVSHGQVQPWNRSDPGPYFPWENFLADVQEEIDASTVTASSVEEQGVQPAAGDGRCSAWIAAPNPSGILLLACLPLLLLRKSRRTSR